eukprot:CAMPEP_0183803106 /NCGR_PEP_ID=MMETSP0803_2-20130417/32181_1 /TAXON_ID=195967 /ORGANISM="Crustomastix stigmata, Strain CCMP3273" /LENGTH=222 /DNA_ID=CAMNT_0026047841 /DNA_START=200 /DNA_END=865 /DNA_ORIENTATION=-
MSEDLNEQTVNVAHKFINLSPYKVKVKCKDGEHEIQRNLYTGNWRNDGSIRWLPWRGLVLNTLSEDLRKIIREGPTNSAQGRAKNAALYNFLMYTTFGTANETVLTLDRGDEMNGFTAWERLEELEQGEAKSHATTLKNNIANWRLNDTADPKHVLRQLEEDVKMYNDLVEILPNCSEYTHSEILQIIIDNSHSMYNVGLNKMRNNPDDFDTFNLIRKELNW